MIIPAGTRLTEAEAGKAIRAMMEAQGRRSASFDVIRRELPNGFFSPAPEDMERTKSRHLVDLKWMTVVRNIARPSTSPDNPVTAGLLYPMRGGGFWLYEVAMSRRANGQDV